MTGIGRRTLIASATVAIALFAMNAGLAQQPSMPGMSKETAYGTYTDKAGRVELVVGTVVAGVEAEQEYIPFQIALGAWGKGPELQVTLENFELHDSSGNVYQAAKPSDVSDLSLIHI